MSFETEATLSLTVDESDLRSVRQQIEDGIGTTAVGVTDGGSMSAQSAGSGGGQSRRARQSMRLAEDRNEHLDDISVYLEDIEDAVTEGGLGGGGGLPGSGIFAEAVGAGAETAGDAAIEAGDTVTDLATDAVGSAIGQAAGSVIANQISGSTVGLADTPVPVTPNPLPVEGSGPGGTTLSPTINTSTTLSPTLSPDFSPEFTPEVDVQLPDLNLGGGADIQTPHPVVVENLDSFEPVSISVGGGAPPASTSSGGGQSIGEFLKQTGKRAGTGAVAGGAIGTISPDPFTTAGGALVGGLTGVGSSIIDTATDKIGGNGQSGGQASSGGVTVEVDHSPTYNIQVDSRALERIVEDAISEVEREHDRDIDELERRIDRDLQGEIDDIRRNITRRR